jgi:hypothetical protein
MKKNPLNLAAITLGLALVAGCHAAPEAPGAQFKGIKVPPGTTLATSRPVNVNLTASAALFPAGKHGQISLARLNGTVLFKGPMSATRNVKLRVSVPYADNEVLASITGADGKQTSVKVPITANQAAWSF